MKTNVIVQGAALTSNVSNRSLSEGSSVYVKVLKNLGNSRFEVSFAGKRFEITSKVPLSEGESFNAKIKIENQKILLIQMLESGVQKSVLENLEGLFDANGKITNPEIIKYFEKLGLFPDSINYSLFQMVKYLGLNFSRQLFSQVRKIALRFPGKEMEAARAALLLNQKGIVADENAVSALIDFEEKSENHFNSDHEYKSQTEKKDLEFEKELFQALKNGFENLLKKLPSEKNPYGFLSLFNHSGFCNNGIKESGSWIKLPFEFDFIKNQQAEKAKGNLYFFINSEEKKAKKCFVKVNFFEKIYKFVLKLNDESRTILISENMNLSALKKSFPDLKFEYASIQQNEDFPVDETMLKVVDGRV